MNKNKNTYYISTPKAQAIGATFFITCSLKGAIPEAELPKLKEEYTFQKSSIGLNQNQVNLERNAVRTKYVKKVDDLLDKNLGPTFLEATNIARILLARIESYHMRYYRLLAISIMPNHFHILIDTSVQIKGLLEPNTIPPGYVQVEDIMNLIKRGSASYINQWRGTANEQVWEDEDFELYIKDEKMLESVTSYISKNPAKAGIISRSEDHPFTFINEI